MVIINAINFHHDGLLKMKLVWMWSCNSFICKLSLLLFIFFQKLVPVGHTNANSQKHCQR